MAFVTATKRGGFEIRESRNTPKGPRSKTLATFRELDDEVIEKARARATKPVSAEELREAATRAGAPAAWKPVERAARELISELGKGRELDPALRRLLADLLAGKEIPASEWMSASLEERGGALVDLLLLTDAVPSKRRRHKQSEPSLPNKVLSIHEALRKARIPHAVGGALALAYYAEPRATTDIDLNVFVPSGNWEDVTGALTPVGITAETLDPSDLLTSGQCELDWGRNSVDLFFATDPIHEEMRRTTRRLPFAGEKLPFVGPEFLAVWKAMLNRPKDWIDIEQMLLIAGSLDIAKVEGWLARMVGEEDFRIARLEELKPT